MELLLIALLVAPFALFMAVRRNQLKLRTVRSAVVDLHCDSEVLRRELADGRTEAVAWSDVREVEVLVTDKGVHAAHGGVVIIGDGHEAGCLVPLDQIGESGIVDELCKLPGFDLNSFVDATMADPTARIEVWQRPLS